MIDKLSVYYTKGHVSVTTARDGIRRDVSADTFPKTLAGMSTEDLNTLVFLCKCIVEHVQNESNRLNEMEQLT